MVDISQRLEMCTGCDDLIERVQTNWWNKSGTARLAKPTKKDAVVLRSLPPASRLHRPIGRMPNKRWEANMVPPF